MRPRRIRGIAETVFRLAGGTEDNDLFVHLEEPCEELPTGAVRSYWQPDDEELRVLRDGGYLELAVLGVPPPPVAMRVVTLGELKAEKRRFG